MLCIYYFLNRELLLLGMGRNYSTMPGVITPRYGEELLHNAGSYN